LVTLGAYAYAGVMRHPDGGVLAAGEPRERVRLATAELIEAGAATAR
jgi:hypothetical protein